MKYKNRTKTKLKYTKVLATVAILSLGMTAIGATSPAFAAENNHSQKIIGEYYEQTDLDRFSQEVLEPKGYLAKSSGYTQISDLKETGQKVITLDSFPLENYTDKTRMMTVPTHSFKTSDGITNTTNKEFTFGQEIGFEAGIASIAGKITGKLSFQEKIGKSISEMHSTEETLSYGGETMEVAPHQKLKVEYTYIQKTYSGEAVNSKEIKGDVGSEIGALALRTEEDKYIYRYHGGKGNIGYLGADLDNIDKREPIELHDAYQIFKLVDNIDDGSIKLLEVHMPSKEEYYKLPRSEVKNRILFDAENQRVFFKDQLVNFSGVSGVEVIQKVTDEGTGEVIKEKQIVSF